jgi:hypothetical protein
LIFVIETLIVVLTLAYLLAAGTPRVLAAWIVLGNPVEAEWPLGLVSSLDRV